MRIILTCFSYSVIYLDFVSFSAFRHRHPELSIRVPELCSIARAMAFNRTTVSNYYDKLEQVLYRHESFRDGSRIYNLDETSTSTVQNARKIVSPKGIKQLHQIKGAERGTSVTTAVIIGAHGTVLPPIQIFPRKKYVNAFLINSFPGALGLANENGYMTKETFVKVMQHFIKCTGSSKQNPTLLILDNVESHFSIETLDMAKDNGVVVFTFPPHCTHRLQPLDVGFFGPFKVYYDAAVNSYYLNNPGKPATIYHISGFVRDALSKAATPTTIIRSFEKTGIFPFNRDLFTEADFLMATVTERPDPAALPALPAPATPAVPVEAAPGGTPAVNVEPALGATPVVIVVPAPDAIPTLSVEPTTGAVPTLNVVPAQANSLAVAITPVAAASSEPEVNKATSNASVPPSNAAAGTPSLLTAAAIRGYPKAKEQVSKRKPRRKGKCMVATDTPEKAEIAEREMQQKEKKQKAEERKRLREQGGNNKQNKKQGKKQPATRKKAQKRLDFSASEAESDNSEAADDVAEVVTPKGNFPDLPRSPTDGDYVLVSFTKSKVKVYYVGKIVKDCDDEGDLEVSYLRKAGDEGRFTLPPIPDIHGVHLSDIKVILPKPSSPNWATKRQQSQLVFDYDFSGLKLG